jgi:hypothetical protein
MQNKLRQPKMIAYIQTGLLLILGISITQSCRTQNKPSNTTEIGFEIKQDNHLYYNNRLLNLYDSAKGFVDAIGKNYRLVVDTLGGNMSERWYWKKKGYMAYVWDNIVNVNMGDDTYKEFSNINEAVKLLGIYDSVYREYIPIGYMKWYVYDSLGIRLWVEDELVHQVEVYPTPADITYFGPLKDSDEYNSPFEIKARSKLPTQPYRGTITYRGNMVNFATEGIISWKKMVHDLDIGSHSYDPPGDGKQWGRCIKNYELSVNFDRFVSEANENRLNRYLDVPKRVSFFSMSLGNEKKTP